MNIVEKIFTPEEVLRTLPVGLTVFYFKEGTNVLYVSEEAARILDYTIQEYTKIFTNSLEIIFEEKLQEFKDELAKLVPGGIPLNFTIYSPKKSGEYCWINLCVSVEEREGYRVYYLISKDISGLKELLDEKATIDPLTGLLNRGALEEQYNIKMKTMSPTEQYAFILIDIDNFKYINDTYGHQQGDNVICMVADVLRQNFRDDDLVARLGGDEFAIIFWNIKNIENIKKRMESVFNNLTEGKKQLEPGLDVSVSIGIACYPQDGHDFAELYYCADTELYRVKRNVKGGYSIASH